MNFKKLSAIAFVSAAILAGASTLQASPSWSAYSTSMSINEDCSDEIIAQVKEKFESNKSADYAKASLSFYKVPAEQALKAIKTFPNVKKLSFNSVNLTNLDFVKEMPNLEEISYSGTWDFKEPMDLSALTGNTKLVEFRMSSTIIKDLTPLSTCTNLKKVSTYMSTIQNNTISPLKTLVNVEDLDLYGTNVDDFSHLAPLTKLRDICVYATKPNEGAELDYNKLAEIKSLVNIHAGLTKMTSVAFLKDLPNIKSLKFLGEDIDDLETLENSTIEKIRFWSHRKKIDGAKLGKAKTLKELTLEGIDVLTNIDGLGNLTNMRELYIKDIKDHNSPETAIDTSILANMKNLKKVSFEKVEIKDLSKTGEDLEEIILNKVNTNNDKAFDVATIVAPQTRKLELREMKVANVASIAKSFPKLESLTIQKCEGIANYDFLKELPDKTRVTLSKGAISEDLVKELKDSKSMYVNMW
ncbi:MAG: hypothetical protein II961_04175 [Candidatus Riflebacteria bacterium]|nr:hypothetical protein [Candidatus Riflebacteria bacterium]